VAASASMTAHSVFGVTMMLLTRWTISMAASPSTYPRFPV
jgi:hypothetical protein